jgi:hypothetical protein
MHLYELLKQELDSSPSRVEDCTPQSPGTSDPPSVYHLLGVMLDAADAAAEMLDLELMLTKREAIQDWLYFVMGWGVYVLVIWKFASFPWFFRTGLSPPDMPQAIPRK